MLHARLAQVAGAAALVGGVAWVVAIVVHALQPEGCVGDQCLVRPQREATSGTSWLMVLTAVALVAFLAVLLVLLARTGELGWTGVTGVAACLLGIATLAVMTLPALRDQTRPLPGLVAVALGLALVGWTVLRSNVVPTWTGIGLLAGVLLLGGVNEQSSRVLLALPFGIAWLVTGVVLVQRSHPGVGTRSQHAHGTTTAGRGDASSGQENNGADTSAP
jgi:preprotein translocase subunit SecG